MPLSRPDDVQFDLLGVGNAIVDILCHAEDEFLASHALNKGTMTLIDLTHAESLYRDMSSGVEVSGGSVANTVAAVGGLGGRVAYIGKVRDDQLGTIFRHDIRASGVRFDTPPSNDGSTTARCFVMVTPDAARTMATHLGACVELGPEDIDTDLVRSTWVTYLEGYLWDEPRAQSALRLAADTAHDAGRLVALSLSDPFCVDRHREGFRDLLESSVDILFANEDEARSLFQTDDLDEVVGRVQEHCAVAAVTRGPNGALIVSRDDVVEVAAVSVPRVIDTTGAGDLFAAGFLHGMVQGWDAEACGRAGAAAAAEVIGHIGARPEDDLAMIIGQAIGQETAR
ncbi:MAG: adenosine kinase [Actinobacteria bacterium]|nr:adenosine kinase [Actinomycetota bacterium]